MTNAGIFIQIEPIHRMTVGDLEDLLEDFEREGFPITHVEDEDGLYLAWDGELVLWMVPRHDYDAPDMFDVAYEHDVYVSHIEFDNGFYWPKYGQFFYGQDREWWYKFKADTKDMAPKDRWPAFLDRIGYKKEEDDE